ncbi:MAG: M4 family metallopeptidase [Flavobacteriales bacterium]|jgi:Zn-dependent metalloprotease|nr:M4 family metallopeptidase [Flavobacteriales bacterium]
MWEIPSEEAFVKHVRQDSSATYYPTGNLEITAEFPSISMDELHTCWKFDIYAAEPESRRFIYVNASDGSIISDHSRIQHADTTVTAHTMYAGEQEITADWTGSEFRLRETGRGNGIETYNAQYQTTGTYVDFTYPSAPFDDTLSFDQYATDAHLGAEKSYDYFLNIHNRNSVDDNGQILLSRIHWGQNFLNAGWNGEWMTYGDGDTAQGYTPLTALDVCGHELTHGVTQHTAGLVYRWEPGALNESFSDIFGVAVEFYTQGYPNGGDWVLGEDFNWIIRSLEEPNLYDQPDTYMGNYWYPGPYDNAGVHVNSGVQNHWFYLLSEGGSGSNDIGNVFTVTGIGIDDAADIAYRNLSVYLTEYSVHYDARFYAIQSAIDLFGPCSQQAISTEIAWYAVGLGNLPSTGVEADYLAMPAENCQIPTDVLFLNFTSNGMTYEWDW